jgi:hypothetical protein
MEKSDSLFIKDLIRRVHDELIESRNERQQQGIDPIFSVDRLTIEANFIVEEKDVAQGGVKFKLLTFGGADAGAKLEYKQQQVHKITLELSGVDSSDSILTDLEETSNKFMPRNE